MVEFSKIIRVLSGYLQIYITQFSINQPNDKLSPRSLNRDRGRHRRLFGPILENKHRRAESTTKSEAFTGAGTIHQITWVLIMNF